MAKLSHPPDPAHSTPVTNRTTNAVSGSAPTMSPTLLRPVPLETSLQSHGNDNLSPLPPRKESARPSLSPADCHTLKKLLLDVGSASPPPTPSPLEPGKQLSANTDSTGSAVYDNVEKQDEACYVVGDEAADTGYEDEDDSMELSEGVVGVTTRDSLDSLDGPASPIVSYFDRRLQDSVSLHDEKERLRYSSHRPSVAKHSRVKRLNQWRSKQIDVVQDDTIEDIMNLAGKSAPSARPLGLGRADTDSQTIPDDVKQLNRMRLSVERVLEDECNQQDRTAQKQEQDPGILNATLALRDSADNSGVNGKTTTSTNGESATDDMALSQRTASPTDQLQQEPNDFRNIPTRRSGQVATNLSSSTALKQQFTQDTSGADNEDNVTTDDTADAHGVKNLEVAASVSKPWGESVVASSRSRENLMLLVPNPSTTPASFALTAGQNHIQFVTKQSIIETPFTKTLRYFKQYKGTENSPSKRRRNTALPHEVAMGAEIANDSEGPISAKDVEMIDEFPRSKSAPTKDHQDGVVGDVIRVQKNLEGVSQMAKEKDVLHGSEPAEKNAIKQDVSEEDMAAAELGSNDAQKQLILYPRHPAFVDAIGMIPATMFWATAAPVVKYANIAVDLLIDKLRDTYL